MRAVTTKLSTMLSDDTFANFGVCLALINAFGNVNKVLSKLETYQ
ncbi:MAG: hypothetical protein ACK46E_21905 [Pseudanabaena sp.]